MSLTEVAVILVLAGAVDEGVMEFIVSPILDYFKVSPGIRVIVFNIASAVLGVAIALNFQLGLFYLFGISGVIPTIDTVLTGILLGRGSNYIHDFLVKYVLKKNGE